MKSADQFSENTGDSDEQRGSAESSPGTIPVIEEQLHISKQLVETGKVHISKKVLQEEYNADIPVFKEEVVIERKQVGQFIDGEVPRIRLMGDTTIIPVIEEVIVKRLMLVEELHITRRTSQQTVPVHETLRREHVTVHRSENDNPPPATSIRNS